MEELRDGAVGGPARTRWKRIGNWMLGIPRSPFVPREDPFLEHPEEEKIGICCSGGGIRSAAYCLGVLQVFIREGLFRKAKYVSAVSGGSYIAAAHAFVARHSDPALLEEQAPFAVGSPEIAYLRNRSTYIAPTFAAKLGLFGSLLLRTSVNLGFIVVTLFVISRPLAWLYTHEWGVGPFHFEAVLDIPHRDAPAAFVGKIMPTWVLAGIAVSLAVMVILIAVRWPFGYRSERAVWAWARRALLASVGGLLVLVVVPAVSYALVELDPVVYSNSARKALAAAAAVVASLGLAGSLLALAKRLLPKLALTLAILAGPVFLGSVFCVFVADGARKLGTPGSDTGWWSFGNPLNPRGPGAWLILALAFIVPYLVLDVSRTSLGPVYKRRLASAFCLRRRRIDGVVGAEEYPYEEPTALSDSQPAAWKNGSLPQPELIVCAAANVSDPDVTPPGRRATSFTFTPRDIGGPMTGYLDTARYESTIHPLRARDVTLMSAVAASGAAFAPSMGKMTKSYRFLMALFNLRLGVWLENPRRLGDRPLDRLLRRPGIRRRPRMRYLFKEMMGINRLDDRFLYVTDGGHIENLGLVELLRRGCTEIYCLDASGGPTQFNTLAEAIEIARTDLGVEITFDALPVVGDDGVAISQHAEGTIKYPPSPGHPDGMTGRLVYVQSVMTRDLPLDLAEYRKENKRFPRDPTTDQFFDEGQFESYRRLGEAAGRGVIGAYPPGGSRGGGAPIVVESDDPAAVS